MEIFKDKESGIYKVRFQGANGMVERSTRTTSRPAAEIVVNNSRLRDLELAGKAKALTADSLQAIMAGRKITCETALTEWYEWRATDAKANTLRTQSILLNQFLRELGAEKWPVTRITDKLIETFVNQVDGTGSRNRALRLATISNFFKFCSARAYCVGNPSKLVRVKLTGLTHEQKESKRRVPMTEKEYRHIIKHTDGFWRAAVALSYWTGLRLSDIAALEWASITADGITVWTAKRDARVVLPLDEPLIGGGELASIIMGLMSEITDTTYVFPKQRECILDPAKRARLSVQFGRILESLGIEGKSFHCLRHSFATRLRTAGKTGKQIMDLLGHSNETTTGIYVH